MELPSDISKLINLEYLNCSNNKLSHLAPNFSSLTKLTNLDISDNNFQVFPIQVCSLFIY